MLSLVGRPPLLLLGGKFGGGSPSDGRLGHVEALVDVTHAFFFASDMPFLQARTGFPGLSEESWRRICLSLSRRQSRRHCAHVRAVHLHQLARSLLPHLRSPMTVLKDATGAPVLSRYFDNNLPSHAELPVDHTPASPHGRGAHALAPPVTQKAPEKSGLQDGTRSALSAHCEANTGMRLARAMTQLGTARRHRLGQHLLLCRSMRQTQQLRVRVALVGPRARRYSTFACRQSAVARRR
jgi:hypothetical protein